MSHSISGKRIALVILAVMAAAQPLAGQTILPKPETPALTVYVGPVTLSAWSPTKAHAFLSWPAVTGAIGYRITRIENTGDPEMRIAEGSLSWFVFEGYTCTAATGQPNCIFDDVSKAGRLKQPFDLNTINPTVPSGVIYPHGVQSGKLYTYRVWSIFPGSIVSPPSPPATVQVK